MTIEYVQAVINTLDELLGISKNRQLVLDQVTERSKANLQGLDVQPKLMDTTVRLLYNGQQFASVYANVWMLEYGKISLEMPLSTKETWEKCSKDQEYLETLQTILTSCYKDEVVKQFPATKQLFAKTDERIKAEEAQILNDWKAIKEDLEAFFN